MTLTTKGKDWLAQNAGTGTCFTTGGVSYRDADGISRSGGTGDVVNAFYTAAATDNATAIIIAGTSYNNFIASGINGAALVMSDANVAWGMESGTSLYCVSNGGGGVECSPEGAKRCDGNYEEMCINGIWESSYCQYGCNASTGVCNTSPPSTGCEEGTTRCNRGNIETCNSAREWQVSTYCGGNGCQIGADGPECVPSSGGGGDDGDPSGTSQTGPFEVTIAAGEDCTGQGTPNVSLDTTNGYAYFKSAPITRIGMSKILIRNDSGNCRIYMAWEMRMWDNPTGAKPTRCPLTDTEVTEINRYLSEISDTKTLAVTTLPGATTIEGYAQFEIPSYTEGKKIVCFTLWGNYSKQALLDELAAEGYEEDPAW